MNIDEEFEQIYSKIVENNSENLEILKSGAKSETIRNTIIVTIVISVGIVLYLTSYKIGGISQFVVFK